MPRKYGDGESETEGRKRQKCLTTTIIKKQGSGGQCESVRDLHVVLVCNLFLTSLWQTNPEELIKMTKKTRHCCFASLALFQSGGVLVDKYYMAFHLFDVTL